jgi:hypothetical protein
MQRSYAVYWNEGNGARYAGRLDFDTDHAELAGRAVRGARRLFEIVFADVAAVSYRSGCLRLTRSGQPDLEIGSVDGPGTLRELAERFQAAVSPL